MTEPVWYYARGDVEKGPVTGPQIRALAKAGKIRADDFVWKEGMENWVQAGGLSELSELFPQDQQAESGRNLNGLKPWKQIEGEATRPFRTSAGRPREASHFVVTLGHTSLLVGLLTVLLARGCDNLAYRHVERVKAMAAANEETFEQQWHRRLAPLEAERQTLEQKSDVTAAEQQRLQELTAELARLTDQRQGQRQQLQEGEWQSQRAAVRRAEREYTVGAFWREAAFLFGTMVLATGLVAVGYSSHGPERWVCWAILGAILFAIYASGRDLPM